jgi:O-antigen ligase
MKTASVDPSEWLFLVLVASLPVMQPWSLQFRQYTIPPADFLFVPTALAGALAIMTRRKTVRFSSITGLLVLYVLALALSAAQSPDRLRSVIKLCGSIYLIGLALLSMLHVTSLAALRRATTAWLAGTAISVVAAAAGLVLFAIGLRDPRSNIILSIHGSLPEGNYPRVMGLFLNPNMFCAYLVASAAILVAVRSAGWIGRPAFVTMAAGVGVTAFFSLSPGIGGLLIVVAFAVWLHDRSERPQIVRAVTVSSAVGAVALLLAIMVSPSSDPSHRLVSSSRMLTWTGAIENAKSHPWFGHGLGLDVVAIGYRNSSGIYEWLTDAHNAWLSILAQAGVFGLVSFLALVIGLLKGTVPFSIDRSLGTLRAGLTMAFVAGFLYQSLSGSFENTRHVWVLIGLLAAANELHVSVERVNPGPPAAT